VLIRRRSKLGLRIPWWGHNAYDELYKFKDELQHVLVRHEQGATHAAQGYARATVGSDSNFRPWSQT
jgi:glyoxylate carboligase